MCGRIGQYSTSNLYVETLGLPVHAKAPDDEERPRYNVGPGTCIRSISSTGAVLQAWWGFRPHWAVERKVPQLINARADKITGATWKPMLRNGRIVIPADNWFEWVLAKDKKKQPYLLRSKDGHPLFLAGLSNLKPGDVGGPRDAERGVGTTDGIVIVTDASDAGMVDIHDRRPVALTAADARLWLDPDTTVDLAAELARTAARPIEDFTWYPVSREVNRIGNESSDLIKPIEE